MGRRGRGRLERSQVLARIEAEDPALHAELIELRGRDPQAFRKRCRSLVASFPIPDAHKVMREPLAAGRAGQITDVRELLEASFPVFRIVVLSGRFDNQLDAVGSAEAKGAGRAAWLELVDRYRRGEFEGGVE